MQAVNLQKYVNENIVYYVWNTPKEKVDPAHLEAKKKELNTELERWNNYLAEVKHLWRHLQLLHLSHHLSLNL